MNQNDIESLLWDCVDSGDDPDGRGYQSSGITKLAALLAEQGRRVSELENKVAELTAKPTT
jgi:hypothetical protein